jgi:asparagine synthase (glutamine-hydrolysing)
MNFVGFAGNWPDGSKPPILDYPALAAGQQRRSARFGNDGSCALAGDFTAAGDGVLVAVRGLPTRLDAGAESTTPPADPAVTTLDAYLRHGSRCVEFLSGPFALAVIDTRSRETLLAVDRMGVERLVYAVGAGGVIFSASAIDVARGSHAPAKVRPQALYDYLLLHIVPSPQTVFEGVLKLRPGTCVTIGPGGTRTRRYWTPMFIEGHADSDDQLRRDVHQALFDAVAAAGVDGHTGAFLSGGLDSSSVAGMLCKATRASASTFSVGFGVDSYDELAYARIANRHFGCVGHELQVTPADVVDAFPRIAAAYDEPFGNSSAVPTYFCAKAASEYGITHLLAGDGGDEIFAGNERYVRQSIFEFYRRIPARLRRSILEPLVSTLGADSRFAPLRKLRSYVDQARISMPERLETWNFVYRHGADRILDAGFRASVDPLAPLRNMQEVYDSVPGSTFLNHMLFYDWHFTLADNDLRKVSTMCRLAGVRVSYPMLDSRVVDVSIRVPSRSKIRGTELRSFYKQAMANFLPPEIIRKTKHGFGLPFGVWLKHDKRLRELILHHLDSLRARRIVRAAFIDDIVSQHQTGDASFYGYPIWDLAMLDAWMTSHAFSV